MEVAGKEKSNLIKYRHHVSIGLHFLCSEYKYLLYMEPAEWLYIRMYNIYEYQPRYPLLSESFVISLTL
jgi:hypothetical protein